MELATAGTLSAVLGSLFRLDQSCHLTSLSLRRALQSPGWREAA
jgi:hypothetical protein